MQYGTYFSWYLGLLTPDRSELIIHSSYHLDLHYDPNGWSLSTIAYELWSPCRVKQVNVASYTNPTDNENRVSQR